MSVMKQNNKKKPIKRKHFITVKSIIFVVLIICIGLLLAEIDVPEDVVFGILGLLFGIIGNFHGGIRRVKHKESNEEINRITFISITVVVLIICISMMLVETSISEKVIFSILALVFYVIGYHHGRTGRGKHKEVP